jgi:hypothetical protein
LPVIDQKQGKNKAVFLPSFTATTPHPLKSRPNWSRAQACNGYHGPLLALTSPLDAGASQTFTELSRDLTETQLQRFCAAMGIAVPEEMK